MSFWSTPRIKNNKIKRFRVALREKSFEGFKLCMKYLILSQLHFLPMLNWQCVPKVWLKANQKIWASSSKWTNYGWCFCGSTTSKGNFSFILTDTTAQILWKKYDCKQTDGQCWHFPTLHGDVCLATKIELCPWINSSEREIVKNEKKEQEKEEDQTFNHFSYFTKRTANSHLYNAILFPLIWFIV